MHSIPAALARSPSPRRSPSTAAADKSRLFWSRVPMRSFQAGPSDVVTFRNLRLNGIGTGINGIRFLSGRAIHIQNCYIFGFTNNGIDIASAGQANISDTVLSNNFGGIRISTSGAGNMLAALERVQINNSGSFGLRGDGSGGTGAVTIEFTDSQVSTATTESSRRVIWPLSASSSIARPL
jgi:hypothetical protein